MAPLLFSMFDDALLQQVFDFRSCALIGVVVAVVVAVVVFVVDCCWRWFCCF